MIKYDLCNIRLARLSYRETENAAANSKDAPL